MADSLVSLGLDVGTTSTQMVFSRLLVENRAGAFAVPELDITRRELLYRGPVHFTPLLSGERVDTAALRRIVDEEYRRAGLNKEDVDTGAIIITGETSRKENARAVLEELSGYAGEFVVAVAGPALESVLAATGAGAVAYSGETGKTLLHMDIGGGTSNLAWIENGVITATACLNVGGRLVKFDNSGAVTYLSPVLQGLWDCRVGDTPSKARVDALAEKLTRALEMAALRREPDGLLQALWTRELGENGWLSRVSGDRQVVLSFSGGVADCVAQPQPFLTYGDMGTNLGQAIRRSRLCAGEYRLGVETIRATVIGAGCHSTRLSGSTIFHRDIPFPLKNLPVTAMEEPEPEKIRQAAASWDGMGILALPGAGTYADVRRYARSLVEGFGARPILVCLERDMAKALGQCLALMTSAPILCIDRVRLPPGSYLDVAAPTGPALPLVVKTLILNQEANRQLTVDS